MSRLRYAPLSEFRRVRDLAMAPADQAALFATLARLDTLYMIKKAGSGHLGTSFSSLDIVSWLFLNELRRGPDAEDIYFSSKGHDVPALYTVLMGMELLDFDLLHRLRRIDGLPGHPDVSVPHMVTNTGSLGMGISKAKGMVKANRLLGRQGHIYVLMGDGELQEGQVWESLGSAANQGIGEITAIVDHNKVQSDTLVANTSDLGDLEAKFSAFGWHVARCDGNDTGAIEATLRSLDAIRDVPKVIIADTVKGSGVSFMEHTAMSEGEWMYRFHSGAPSDDDYQRALDELTADTDERLAAAGAGPVQLDDVETTAAAAPDGVQRLVPAYSQALIAQAERNDRIVALDGDLVLDTGLIPFAERFPDRFFECGIAEQDMVSQAGGMALRGLLPVVHSFACFLSTRPNEHIYNNATERTKVMYVGALAGIVPGGPGHSHQSVRDVAALGAMPGMVLVEPGNEDEVGLAVEYLLGQTSESSYLRLASVPVPVPYSLPAGYRFQEGRGAVLTEGADAILFGYGPVLLTEAFKAASMLAERGVGLQVVDLPWLNRVDEAWLAESVAGKRWVFTLDDQYLTGGQGEMVLSRLATLDLPEHPRAAMLGVRDIPACGTNDEVLQAHRLDATSLAEDISAAMGG